MSHETLVLTSVATALAVPALVVMATGGGFGAAVLVAILFLPISAPVAGAVFGAAAELFRTKP